MTEPDAELVAKLDDLNREVAAALAKRRAWMDAHMGDFSRYQVGEVLFNLTTGRELGEIVELYRYYAGDARFDNSMTVEYNYRVPTGCIDNTSRQPGLIYGTADDLVRRRESDLQYARFKADPAGEWAKIYGKGVCHEPHPE